MQGTLQQSPHFKNLEIDVLEIDAFEILNLKFMLQCSGFEGQLLAYAYNSLHQEVHKGISFEGQLKTFIAFNYFHSFRQLVTK